jgi:hypothetical protein
MRFMKKFVVLDWLTWEELVVSKEIGHQKLLES